MKYTVLKALAAASLFSSFLVFAADPSAFQKARISLQEKIKANDIQFVLDFIQKDVPANAAFSDREKATLIFQGASILQKNKKNAEYAALLEKISKDPAYSPAVQADAIVRLALLTAPNGRDAAKLKQAFAMCDQVLAMPGLPADIRRSAWEARIKFYGYDSTLSTLGKSLACYDEILKLYPDEKDQGKILLKKAECADKGHASMAAISAIYEDALKRKGLNVNDEQELVRNYADLLAAAGKFQQAQDLVKGFADKTKRQKNPDVLKMQAGIYEDMQDYEKAYQAYMEAQDVISAAMIRITHQNRTEEGIRMLADLIRTQKDLKSIPYGLFRRLSTAIQSEKVLAAALKDQLIPALLTRTPEERKAYRGPAASQFIFGKARNGNSVELLDLAIALDEALGRVFTEADKYTLSVEKIEMLAIAGRFAEAKALLKTLAAAPVPAGQELTAFRLAAAQEALSAGSREKAAQAAGKMFAAKKDSLPADKLADELAGSASILYLVNERDASMGISDFRTSLYPDATPLSAPCPYMDRAPQSVMDWMLSDIVKQKQGVQKLERKLGSKSLKQLFETDSNMGARILANEKASKDNISTEFYTRCDAKGIYILILGYDDKAKLIDQNFIGGDQYEIYFAPGERQPYHNQILYPLSDPRAPYREFWTGYPNRFAVNARITDNSGIQHSQVLVRDNLIATLLFYPWQIFWNVLPDQKGDTYVFDFIRFNRTGAYTWSGTSSVHSRSTWGRLVFDLTPAQLTAIRKNILVFGKNRFNAKADGTHGRANGPAMHWASPEAGDPAFSEQVVMPETEKIRASLAGIKADMTDEEVNRLFLQMAPLYYNYLQNMDQYRKEYLEKQLFAE